MPSSKRPLVAAYYFPNYHPDARNAKSHGPGWTEWDLVRHARPRFPGHRQPLVPAWGYEDESDPAVMERKIAAAASHGVDCFLFDWYYYDDGPFLERCLEDGFLKARNVDQIRFACMWANHDWENIHPAKRNHPRHVSYPGKVTPQTFERMTDLVIDRYFSHPSHLQVDGAPFFSIYNLSCLVDGFGGSLVDVQRALDRFREKTIKAGFRDLHLDGIGFNVPVLTGERGTMSVFDAAESLGFNSIGNYVWVHFDVFSKPSDAEDARPATDYAEAGRTYFSIWEDLQRRSSLPIYPNVTMGWDPSPRTTQTDVWDPRLGYPFTQVLGDNSPAAFRQALEMAREYAQRFEKFSMVTLNAWNEWTEGSYLEPDTHFGYGYLEAIRKVFPPVAAPESPAEKLPLSR